MKPETVFFRFTRSADGIAMQADEEIAALFGREFWPVRQADVLVVFAGQYGLETQLDQGRFQLLGHGQGHLRLVDPGNHRPLVLAAMAWIDDDGVDCAAFAAIPLVRLAALVAIPSAQESGLRRGLVFFPLLALFAFLAHCHLITLGLPGVGHLHGIDGARNIQGQLHQILFLHGQDVV